MIKDVIVDLKKSMLEPKEEYKIKDLFMVIEKSIQNNFDLINKAYLYDTGSNLPKNSITGVFIPSKGNQYGNLSMPFMNSYGRVSENMVPYGVVGLIIERQISLTNYLEIIKVCIETRNSLIIKPFKQSEALKSIIEIINDIMIIK